MAVTPMMRTLRGTTSLHPNAAVLRDPVTIVSAISTFAASSALAAFVVQVGVSLITSWALSLLLPKPKLSTMQGLLTNKLGAAEAHHYVYGKVRKGGTVTYYESTGANNKYLHIILSLCGHEVNSIGDIYVNDEVVTLDGSGFVTDDRWLIKNYPSGNDRKPEHYIKAIRIKKHLGTSGQTVDPDLLAESSLIDANFKGQGIAYLYIRLEYDRSVFPNGIPTFTALVEGKKVYDPRTSTTGYSANAALCIRDYIVNSRGLDDPGVNDVDMIVAANICDELVTTTSGTEKRYEMNGIISSDIPIGDVLSRMVTSCAGTLWYGTGNWRLKVGAYTSPVKTFTIDDFRSDVNIQTRIAMRDNYNIIRGTFVDANQDYIVADFPQIYGSSFIVEDGGEEVPLDMEFPFTTSSPMVQRLAKMTLFRGREQMTFSADFGMSALDVSVGDIVAISNARYGWVNKEFEVVNWRFFTEQDVGDLRVNMVLRETSEAAFDWNAEESDIIGNATNLPDPFGGLNVNNLIASGGGKLQGDGTFINSVILDWDDVTNPFFSRYEVEWKATVDSVYNATTCISSDIELSPLIDGVEYTIRVRSVTTTGINGPWTTVLFTGGGDVTAPGLPTSITATGGFKYITVEWTNPTDADLNYVEVWENTSNTTAGATKIGVSAGDQFVRTNLGLNETRWYFLKAVDYTGNASAFTSGVSATTTYLDDEAFANGIYSLFTEQGLYAIEDVTSLPPSGDFTGQKVFNRTDGKLYQWTGSAWELVIAEPDSFIASDKIIANTITGGLLATSGIITNSAQITDGLITNAKIKDAAITTAKIGDNQVTFPQAISGSSWVDLNLASGETEVQSLTVTRSGAPAMITAGAIFATVNGGFHGYSRFNYRLYRDGVMVKGYLNCKNQGQDSPSITMFHTDTHSATCTYSLRVEVIYLYDENITHQRVLTPYISFVELKK